MKRWLIILTLLLVPTVSFAQQKDVTKMQRFMSKTGKIIKFIDHNLPDIPTRYSSIESKIRTIEVSGERENFFQIEKKAEYGKKVASIAEEDLIELIKALNKLKQMVATDIQSDPDYLENKFVTEDGFQVGYYVSHREAKWFIVLERFGSDNTVFFNNVGIIKTAFALALKKMRALK